jgi:hypothetical protein
VSPPGIDSSPLDHEHVRLNGVRHPAPNLPGPVGDSVEQHGGPELRRPHGVAGITISSEKEIPSLIAGAVMQGSKLTWAVPA